MIITNHTPFVPFVFTSVDVRDRMFGVLVVRGTFGIIPRARLDIDPEQTPIVFEDVFYGDATESSLRFESDLAPFKPRTDIHIHAVARAPGGWPLPRWPVRVRVGVLEKILSVCGPRWWVREGSTYRLTDPEACAEVPLRYELAFGGVENDAWAGRETFQENPVGTGYLRPGRSPGEFNVPAPQIEAPDAPITEMSEHGRPEGLGPICRAWLPRRARAGTYDDAWLSQRWPSLPHDFSFSFYNSAHPDLTYPGYLRGNEVVVLEGVHDHGPMEFSLPGCQIVAKVTRNSSGKAKVALVLDTLAIDVPAERAYLTWRAIVPPTTQIQGIELMMGMDV